MNTIWQWCLQGLDCFGIRFIYEVHISFVKCQMKKNLKNMYYSMTGLTA
jgi:hypothetical protein